MNVLSGKEGAPRGVSFPQRAVRKVCCVIISKEEHLEKIEMVETFMSNAQ